MRICLVTPAPLGSRKGNRISAVRWARFLRELGHRVVVEQEYRGRPCDLLIALHARRSAESVERFHREHPELPLVLALTGTDLYQDIRTDPSAQRSLELATRLVVMQPMGIRELPRPLRDKARVIFQSVQVPAGVASPAHHSRPFMVCVLGHMRPVKDPFRTAAAARLLPASSRIRIVHVGGALSKEMERLARAEAAANPRYEWLGELPRGKSLRVLARSQLLSLTSEMEGGANVVCESIALSVPVISSRISGSIGILGAKYPGYFPVRDTQALARLLRRAETDANFYTKLVDGCVGLAALVDPARERESWKSLLAGLSER